MIKWVFGENNSSYGAAGFIRIEFSGAFVERFPQCRSLDWITLMIIMMFI